MGRGFSSRREEAALQRQLARGLLRWPCGGNTAWSWTPSPWEGAPTVSPILWGRPSTSASPTARGWWCCCLHTDEVGVDAEGPRPFSPRLARRICTKEEAAWLAASPDPARDLTALWTLKESVMKLEGQGIAMGFQNAAFTFPEGKPRSAGPQAVLSQFFLEGGFVVSAAAEVTLSPSSVSWTPASSPFPRKGSYLSRLPHIYATGTNREGRWKMVVSVKATRNASWLSSCWL